VGIVFGIYPAMKASDYSDRRAAIRVGTGDSSGNCRSWTRCRPGSEKALLTGGDYTAMWIPACRPSKSEWTGSLDWAGEEFGICLNVSAPATVSLA